MKTANSLSLIARKAIVAALGATFLNAAFAGALDPTSTTSAILTRTVSALPACLLTIQAPVGKPGCNRVWTTVFSLQREKLLPPRGQPGWASTVLLLDPQGLPRDASAYEGIRLLVTGE